mgnify:CR=1 FL=1
MNILILTAGNVSKIEGFVREGVTTASFNDVSFDSQKAELFVLGQDIKNFSIIYFRVVGKSLEIATLVANYAVKNNIKLVDNLYSNTLLMPISLAKSLEIRKLLEAGIKIPRTVFGSFSGLDFPYVVKSTSGQKAREVWMVKNPEELEVLKTNKFVKGKFYFAQELIPNAERVRVLVVGDKAIGAIKRQTKWNKTEIKETLNPIPDDLGELAVNSAKAVDLQVCGVDILINSKTQEKFIIEANAAPAWKGISKHCSINVEDEIIKYIQTKI